MWGGGDKKVNVGKIKRNALGINRLISNSLVMR